MKNEEEKDEEVNEDIEGRRRLTGKKGGASSG